MTRSSRKSSSVVKRREPVAKRRKDSQDHQIVARTTSPGAGWEDRGRRGSSAGREADYDRGQRDSTDMATLEKKTKENRNLEGRAASLSRKGSNAATLAKRRESNPNESQHFLSLQLFNAHAEPGLNEYLPIAKQLELEQRQREEEDALYRKFIQERREQEDVVGSMEEEERERLFDKMNKMERSRIINLADKHCAQMLDLIHRWPSLLLTTMNLCSSWTSFHYEHLSTMNLCYRDLCPSDHHEPLFTMNLCSPWTSVHHEPLLSWPLVILILPQKQLSWVLTPSLKRCIAVHNNNRHPMQHKWFEKRKISFLYGSY